MVQSVGLSFVIVAYSLVIYIVCFCLRIFCTRGWTFFLLVQSVGLSFVIVAYFLVIFTLCFCLRISAKEVRRSSYNIVAICLP